MDPNTPTSKPIPNYEQPLTPPPAGQIPSPPPSPISNSGGNKKRLIFIVLGVLVGLAVLVFGALFVFALLSGVQTSSVAKNFMTNMTQGKVDEALKQVSLGDDPEGTKAFMQHAADSVKGSFSSKDSTKKDDKAYYLYNLTNEQNKYARVTLTKTDGHWKVISFVFGPNELALIPKDSSSSTSTTSSAGSTSSGTCLVQSDFDGWYKAQYQQTATAAGLHFDNPETPFTGNVHFMPDSLEYSDNFETGFLEGVANLAKSVPTKQFTIRLTGRVATTAKADLDFANQRSEKVKKALIDLGVPPSKIAIEQAGSVADFGQDQVNNSISQQVARSVVFIFDPTCSATAPAGTGR